MSEAKPERSILAVVVIPVYKQQPSLCEELSYRRAVEILSRHPMALVAPDGLDLAFYTKIHSAAIVERFHASFFRSVSADTRLMLTPKYYERFRSFRFILAHQLDAFVFRDELSEWCGTPYDYIGAPWIKDMDESSSQVRFDGVGNGGFCLRRISAVQRALRSFSMLRRPSEILGRYLVPDWRRGIGHLPGLVRQMLFGNNSFWLLNDNTTPADIFFGSYVARNFAWFRVAPPEVAMKFSFERYPRRLYEMTNRRLPFGCHAWSRYDPEFWRPHISAMGHDLRDIGEGIGSNGRPKT